MSPTAQQPTAAADNLELAEVRDANPAETGPQTPQPTTAVLLVQAQERNRVATEALAEAEAELERARNRLVQTPGRPAQEAVAWARELGLQAQDEAAASAEAVRVYSARAKQEDSAASYARAVALMEAAAAERAEKANAIAAKETARRERIAADARGFQNRLANIPIDEDPALRYHESEPERQERFASARLRGWQRLLRVQGQERDRRDLEDAER